MSLVQDGKVAQAVTADATPTSIAGAAITLGDDREGYAECVVVAKSGTNAKSFKVAGTVKRAAGGSASIVGAIQALLTAQGDAGLATAVCTLVASANTILPQVTGIAVTSITWDVWLTITYKP